MAFQEKNFRYAYPVLIYFVYHTASYRELHKAAQSLPGESALWIASYNAHAQMAITSWCKVFGSIKEPTHYSNLSSDANRSFESYFLSKYQYDANEWTKYRRDMKRFRDKFIAHCEEDFKDPVPKLDIALHSAYAYDHWSREIMSPITNSNQYFEASFPKWSKEIASTLTVLKV